jgi:intraflagellar transport protein 140
MEIGKEISGRYPGVHYWEHDDPRLLVCEAYLLPNSLIERVKKSEKQAAARTALSDKPSFFISETPNSQQNAADDQQNSVSNECLVISMFFNIDKGLLVYDSYPRGEIYSKLISVKIPSHFFVTKVFYLFSCKVFSKILNISSLIG